MRASDRGAIEGMGIAVRESVCVGGRRGVVWVELDGWRDRE